ncbi:vWA domain-containing protein [Corynebacterium accolens]|uniref:vWA domain-containing protein n=1 Tax=Corynebacterium accolens TaxID=38284 RepID=UPI00254FD504|nr:vWA domain-containing protein [Corynebacterium accolens]MDK8469058.1 VWA domain-containing protein [Corynebacterium accolens]MDK8497056.1 VWA domain-containing protein [Corynebacterium accolens]MDK8593687.1 VWA domain-containing protein [Corynebacterium accolens]MDK8673851.1 VWA domain-containing protein [Corynebacterium accolens]
MARHSNEENKFAIAGWVVAVAIIAILAVIALVVFLMRGGDDSSETTAAETTSESPVESSTAVPSSTPATSGTDAAKPSEAGGADKNKDSSSPAASSTVEMAPNTLLLVDTSANMTAMFDATQQALSGTAGKLSQNNSQVALWNYSSPISEAATVGYRDNLGFGNGAAVPETLAAFGTGGVPQSRSATIAALNTAADQAAGTNQKARVVLVTTGTELDMDEAQFAAALDGAKSDNVELSVVHVGPGAVDEQLKHGADNFTSVDAGTQEDLNAAMDKAAGV